jgi:ATP-dependent DNA ligase
LSRNGIDVTTKYAALLPALQKIDGLLRCRRRALRGRPAWHSRFQLLQNALNKKARLLYGVFDAPLMANMDVREKPLVERKEIPKGLLPRDPLLRATVSTSLSSASGKFATGMRRPLR